MTQEYRQPKFSRPSGATEILLVRHGESRAATPEAPFPLVDGHGDPELHPQGLEQAVCIGHRLKRLPIAAVYVTSLQRTLQTALPLCTHLGVEPIVERDLREIHLGEWEGGLYRMKAHANDPVYQRMHEEERWDVIPGAEAWETVNRRVSAALARIAGRHPDQLVVAVVHGGIIGHILAHAAGARPFAFNGADNGSISHIVMTGGRIRIRRFNDTSHLTSDVEATQSLPT